jgi:hypothetical protein
VCRGAYIYVTKGPGYFNVFFCIGAKLLAGMADLTINDRIFGDIPAKNAVCTPYIYGSANQEGVGSITFGRHVSNRLKIIYLEF